MEGNIYSKMTMDSSLKFTSVLMIIVVLASAMAVLFIIHTESDYSSAEVVEDGWCGPNAYYYVSSDGTLLINGVGSVFDFSGFIHAPWYDHREDIRKIVIGNDITQLGASAFIGLKYVTELTIPITINSVVSDVDPAFAGCYRIEKINFTVGNNGYGYNYAAYCGSDSWYQNTPWYQSRDSLKEINFADGIIHIGNDAFRELNITKVVLSDSVTSLGDHCFFNCTKLTDLTIPVSFNPYGNETYHPFQGCTVLEIFTFTNGNGVPFDYYNPWYGAYKVELAPWNMNSSVAKTIIITDSVAHLGKYMFLNCNIKELTIPVSVPLTDLAFETPYNNLEKVIITKGNGEGCDYDEHLPAMRCPWNRTSIQFLTVEEGVTYLGSFTFINCNADKVVLPDSLVTIGECVFTACMIKDLTVPISLNAVRSDVNSAFYAVFGLEKVTFTPGTGYGYDYSAYDGNNCWYLKTPWYQCRNTLKEIVFESGIKSIGSDAFRELNFTALVIPDSVLYLGNHTFFCCEKLTDLTIPISLDSVYSADYPAFDKCRAIKNLRLTVGKYGYGADYNDHAPAWCTPLCRACKIQIDSGIKYIGANTFEGYVFWGSDGEYLEHTSENLSGHLFCGTGGIMYLSDRTAEDQNPVERPFFP